MNGRLYDPRLHRFLQPDNNLQEPYNTQNYNRYGYVLNNPLKYTDPSGEFTWSDFVAGVAIVVGVVVLLACLPAAAAFIGVSIATMSSIAGGLVLMGANHFVVAANIYKQNGGDWDSVPIPVKLYTHFRIKVNSF